MIAMPLVGFSSSPRFVEHETGPHHPERPDRIRAIHRAVREAGLIDSPDPFPEFQIDLGLRALTPSPRYTGERGLDAAFVDRRPRAPSPSPLPSPRLRAEGASLLQRHPQFAEE